MRKRRNGIVIISLIVALAIIIGCEKDSTSPDNNESSLEGTWIISSLLRDGVQVDIANAVDVVYKIVLNEDNTGFVWIADYGNIEDDPNFDFTWTINGNKLTMGKDGDIREHTYSLSENILDITWMWSSVSEPEYYVFERQ